MPHWQMSLGSCEFKWDRAKLRNKVCEVYGFPLLETVDSASDGNAEGGGAAASAAAPDVLRG